MAIIDVPTHTVVQTINVARYDASVGPVGVQVSPDGSRIYLANGRGNSVSVIDTVSYDLLETIPVGERVWGIGMTRDGKKLYAANGLSNDVSVIDTLSEKVTATIPVGEGAGGVAIR